MKEIRLNLNSFCLLSFVIIISACQGRKETDKKYEVDYNDSTEIAPEQIIGDVHILFENGVYTEYLYNPNGDVIIHKLVYDTLSVVKFDEGNYFTTNVSLSDSILNLEINSVKYPDLARNFVAYGYSETGAEYHLAQYQIKEYQEFKDCIIPDSISRDIKYLKFYIVYFNPKTGTQDIVENSGAYLIDLLKLPDNEVQD